MENNKLIEHSKDKIAALSDKFWTKYEDEESMANDLLDMALDIITQQGRLIRLLEEN